MRVLAIETSCDETGVAVLEGRKTNAGFEFQTLGAALLSQAPLHNVYGGVYPTLAKREHQKNLPLMLEQALAKASLTYQTSQKAVDVLAVTEGPGLEPALWTGITFAQQLAQEWDKPLFGVNHMEGHLISSLVQDGTLEKVNMPVLALLVSGGHTEFILMKDWFSYERLGETLDDAVGECFDKVARMLGLPYPGGREISRLARRARESNRQSLVSLPRPMLQSGNCDVSFSGLKTAALYALRNLGGVEQLSEDDKEAFAKELEDAVTDVFISKTRRALEENDVQIFVIGGGVAANIHLRNSLVTMIKDEFPEVKIRLPELYITGDNAIMIGEAALVHLLSGDWDLTTLRGELRAIGNLSIA